MRPGFEGGQLPLYRKLPKRGFYNNFATKYAVVNIATLNDKFENGDEIDINVLLEAGIIKNPYDGLKVLGNGELNRSLTVKAAIFSAAAREKFEAAGGKAEVI